MIPDLELVLSRLEQHYMVIKELGQGGASVVYLVKEKQSQRLYAAKLFFDMQNGLHEAWILQNIHHPLAPSFHQLLTLENTACLIMDYVEGRSLHEYCQEEQPSLSQIFLWVKQMAYFFQYLHSLPTPIYYLDLKPDNLIVLSNGNLKLIDYNAACFEKEGQVRFGTRGYAPQEMYDTKESVGSFSDRFTLGRLIGYLRQRRKKKWFCTPRELKQLGILWLLQKLCLNDFMRKRVMTDKLVICLCERG